MAAPPAAAAPRSTPPCAATGNRDTAKATSTPMVPAPRYDVLELKYGDGTPAVLRHVDGSGFAYYQSGRKAICITSFGRDGKGKVRRFAAIVHGDGARSPVLAAFDEWGRGYADGQMNPGDCQQPKLLIGESSLTVVDGGGRATDVPVANHKNRRVQGDATGGSTEVSLRLNQCVSLQHQRGRSTLNFSSGGVQHSFVLGELQGEEVLGMPAPTTVSLAEETMKRIGEATSTLDGVREKVSGLRVDVGNGGRNSRATGAAEASASVKASSNLQELLESLNSLTQSLAQPGLAPVDLQWNTEGKLKKLLAASHPKCPGQKDKHNWSISRVSGRCTDERLQSTKPTVATPKTVSLISQLKLPETIDECAQRGTLLVVICLATYVLEQSTYARLLAERVHAELHQRFRSNLENGLPLPVQFAAIELSEIGGFASRYGIKEVPYCLMFQGGSVVYSKRLRGMRLLPKDAGVTQPHVLLVEPVPQQQLKLERCLRRSGSSWDLAMDVPQAMRLTSRQVAYDAALISSRLRLEEQRSIATAIKRLEPSALVLLYDTGVTVGVQEEDAEARKRFHEECSHLFVYSPSYAALSALLSRCESDDRRRVAGVGADKRELLDEVLGVLEKGRRGGGAIGMGTIGADSPQEAVAT